MTDLTPRAHSPRTVLILVVGAVGGELIGGQSRSPKLVPDRHDRADERQEVGDVVAVAAGEHDGQRDAARVGQQAVL